MPFIAWLLFWHRKCSHRLLKQIALASFFFFKIHPSALPLSTALNILSKVCTLVFLSTLLSCLQYDAFRLAVRKDFIHVLSLWQGRSPPSG